MASYVKFQKGSQAAYDNLTTKNPNTLYFIYEEGASVGKLYIGSTLISGGDVSVANGSLAELTDVILTNAQTNNFLVYENNKWVNKSAADVANIILQFNTSLEIVDGKLSIAGFNTANSNTILSKNENGNLVWITNEIDETLQDIQNALGQPGTESTAATGVYAELENKASKEDLANINKLVKEVVDTLPEVGEENVLYLVTNASGYRDEYMWIGDKWELIGNTDINLNNYVTKDELNAIESKVVVVEKDVESLEQILNGYVDKETLEEVPGLIVELETIKQDYLTIIDFNKVVGDLETLLAQETTFVDRIEAIEESLKWQDIV